MSGPGPGEPQPQQPPQQPPQPPPGPGPAAPPSMPAWTASLTSTAPTPGPAGLFYADVPNRVFAFIIDAIIVGIVSLVVESVLPSASQVNLNPTSFGDLITINPVGVLLRAAVGLVISGAYFIYMWTKMRGTVGMMVIGLQLGNETDGKNLTMNQAIYRWAFLFGPSSIAGAASAAPGIGWLISLVAFIWVVALIVTTAQSPTKQGLHDRYAHTIMVKAARTIGA
jgi:uncharacterized RDD family membrane protein YckC